MTIDFNVVTKEIPVKLEVTGGGGVTSYNKLKDKPSINGTVLEGDVTIPIPDKTSDLTNDSGFITADDIPAIPSKTSELDNDSNFITADDIPHIPTNVSELINDSDYATKSELPVIPTNVSAFVNDANYVKAEDIPKGAEISKDAGNILTTGTDDGLYVATTDLSDYAKKADIPFVPEDVSAFNNDAGYITESAVPKNVSQLVNDAGYIDSSAIPDVSVYALTSEAGYDLGLSMDSKTYEMTIELKNKAGTVLSTKKLDFPIESMVIGASYKDGKLTLTLQSGSTLDVDISAIVGGLVNDSFTIAGIDMKDDITANELKTALGVVDAYTKTEVDALLDDKADVSDIPDISNKADKSTTLSGYGIADAYTKSETDTLLDGKADTGDIPDVSGKADKTYVDTELGKKVDVVAGKGLSTNDFTDEYKQKIDDAGNLIDDETISNDKTWSSTKINDKFSNISTGIDLTREQYDALPDTKYSDGVDYYITDEDTGVIHPMTKEEYDNLSEDDKHDGHARFVTGYEFDDVIDDDVVSKASTWSSHAINKKLDGVTAGVDVTEEEYKELKAQGLVKPDVDYHITDGKTSTTVINDTVASKTRAWSGFKTNEELNTIKASLNNQSITYTQVSTTFASGNQSFKCNGIAFINISTWINPSLTKNTWTKVGEINVAPRKDTFIAVLLRDANGTILTHALIRINTDKTIKVSPSENVSVICSADFNATFLIA